MGKETTRKLVSLYASLNCPSASWFLTICWILMLFVELSEWNRGKKKMKRQPKIALSALISFSAFLLYLLLLLKMSKYIFTFLLLPNTNQTVAWSIKMRQWHPLVVFVVNSDSVCSGEPALNSQFALSSEACSKIFPFNIYLTCIFVATAATKTLQ